jgi:hypothetical protein
MLRDKNEFDAFVSEEASRAYEAARREMEECLDAALPAWRRSDYAVDLVPALLAIGDQRNRRWDEAWTAAGEATFGADRMSPARLETVAAAIQAFRAKYATDALWGNGDRIDFSVEKLRGVARIRGRRTRAGRTETHALPVAAA